MFIPYLLKLFLWPLIMSFGFGGWLVVVQPPRDEVGDSRSLIERTAEKVEAEQLGGDKLTLSPLSRSGLKTLPLAASRLEKRPRRKENEPDFDWRKLTAQAIYVIDKETDSPLLDYQENEPRSIGSLTKLMTALVFLDSQPNWEQVITLEEGDGRQGRLYLTEGESAAVRDIFYTSLISSSNNATMALARSAGVSLEEFVIKMNEKARALGLKQTRFTEPTGLDPGNQSTAKEIAFLLKMALAEKDIREAAAKKTYSFQLADGGEWRKIRTTNLLLSGDLPLGGLAKVNAGKTGFVEEAGYCFAMETEDKNGHQIIVVILGSATHFSRFSEARAAAEWAFEAYEWPDADILDQ